MIMVMNMIIMVMQMMMIMMIMIILLIDAGMLSRHSGESHRVTLHKIFSPGHFVTLGDGDDEKEIKK